VFGEFRWSGRWAVTEFAFAPTPAQKLLGRTPKRKMSFPFQKKITPAKIQRSKEHFFFLVLPSEARRWRGDSSSVRKTFTSHGAWSVRIADIAFISQIINFENRF
jgi:hypothetical protein